MVVDPLCPAPVQHRPINMNKSIVQWNCRGFRANFNELCLLCNDFLPSVIALQETFLQTSIPSSFTGFNIIRKDVDSDHPSGGVALMIHHSVMFSELTLDTPLQAVAARVSLHKTITICSLYLPPTTPIVKEDLMHLFQQLPSPFFILGDFNGHSPLWGSDQYNIRGRIIESVLDELDLCVLNSGTPTYLHPASASATCIDLTVCDPSIMLDFEWHVHDDQCGSDHFPVVVSPVDNEEDTPVGRWNLKKANWLQFSSLCQSHLTEEEVLSADDPTLTFTSILTEIAEITIPKTTTVPSKPRKPWFTEECKSIRKERKKAQRKAQRCPTIQNILQYKRLRAKARYTFKKAKKESWKHFVSSLSSKTPSQKVWKAIRKIKGKGGTATISHLRVGDKLITDKKAVANLLASTISKNSSSSHYSSDFQKVKSAKESKPHDFSSDDSESYNLPFTFSELKSALQKCNDSAAGLDSIHYQLLTHLPDKTLHVLLAVFNHVWTTGLFPSSWREAEIVPIPKPGKDLSNPNNYRPIALTSCICKTMERLVNARIVWYLESNNLISDIQCGFRQGRSTVDHLVRFETFIREAFVKKQHVLAIFFDLEKAYDTTWKEGIIDDIYNMGIRGRLPKFIQGFLSDRTFKVRVGSTHSDTFEQEMGVPQGSILSPVLFSIKINDIVKAVTAGTDASLFVDDFALCVRGSTLHRVERHLQLCVNNVQSWVTDNGFKFSPCKTVCVHFTQKRGTFPDPNINIGSSPITVAKEAKFLGVIFDSKLSFLSHIKYLRTSCQKALDVLRVVGHTDWGSDRTVLLRLYRSLVRSKLDYACIVWGSARKSYLQMLDPIHHQGLRICLGAFRTSPVQSLYVEAGEPSLSIRRTRLAMNYVLKLKSDPHNPAYKCVFNPNFVKEFEYNTFAIPPLSLRIHPHIQAAGINLDCIEEKCLPCTPPWCLPTPEILFDLTEFKKGEIANTVFQQRLYKIFDDFQGFSRIFTDGSRSQDGRVGAAAVLMQNPPYILKHRLVNGSSIFSAELQAILLALKHIYQSQEYNFLILSDSLSALQALENNKLDHPLLIHIQQLHASLLTEGKDIIFVWIPSHIGISGNNQADFAANQARSEPVIGKHSIFSDFKPLVNEYIHREWQTHWDALTENKLHEIIPNILDCICRCRTNRREEVVLCRLHIGHSYFTHAHLLKDEEKPFCYSCHMSYTIEHILISCADLIDIRRKYYNAESMKVLFRDVPPDRIFAFLKEINIYHKI